MSLQPSPAYRESCSPGYGISRIFYRSRLMVRHRCRTPGIPSRPRSQRPVRQRLSPSQIVGLTYSPPSRGTSPPGTLVLCRCLPPVMFDMCLSPRSGIPCWPKLLRIRTSRTWAATLQTKKIMICCSAVMVRPQGRNFWLFCLQAATVTP